MLKRDVEFKEEKRRLTAYVKTELDHHNTRFVRDKIDERVFLVKPEILILDFSEVRFMDSSGIALILGRVETAAAVGATVQLTGLTKTLFKLVRLAGIEKIHGITVNAPYEDLKLNNLN